MDQQEVASIVPETSVILSHTTSDQPVKEKTEVQYDALQASDASMWAVTGDSYVPCEKSQDALPAGHYVIENNPERGIYWRKHDFSVDSLLHLPDSASESVIREIEQFWELEPIYNDYGFLWKRGVLLWGAPGSGKTSTVQIIAQNIIRRGGIAVSVYHPRLAAAGLHILRKIEPKRPVIAILEDIESIISEKGESELLALLDGEQQINNVVYLATTNYPENLDPRFINRPSRFDTVQQIGMPNKEARLVYIKARSKTLTSKQIEQWAIDTEGFSIAHIKELIISYEVRKVSYDDTLARLRKMCEHDSSSKEYLRKPVGFKSIASGWTAVRK